MSFGRILYLDLIRIFACALVVLQHTPMPNLGTPGLFLSALSFLTYPAIGLFYMVSGALLLPVKSSSEHFYKSRLSKVIYPTFFWSLIYIIVFYVSHEIHPQYLIKSLILLPLAPQGTPVFWFIYVLIGLYLFAPIISPWLDKASRKDLHVFLTLWGITLLLPIISRYTKIPYGYYSVLCYFGGYLGYFVLGYYVRRYLKTPLRWYYSCLLISLPIIAYAICKTMHMRSDFNTYYYLSIFSALMTVGWFTLFQRINWKFSDSRKCHRWLVHVSCCTFGIYLIHILVMKDWLWHCSFIYSQGYLFQIVVTFVLTLLFSYIVTHSLSKLPFSKYLIGF